MATSTSSKVDWLYPELLSKEGLTEILQRFVKLPDDIESISRDDLLDLYYQFVIPQPQRKYRQNRRGRDMARKQIVQNKKRKITGPDFTEPSVKKSTAEPSSRLLTSFEAGPPAGDRLKPPPSCINFDKKVIKLGGSRTSSDSPSSTITSPTSVNSSSESSVGGAFRVIKLNCSPSGDAKSPTCAPETVTVNKTIKLINSHISGSGDSAKKSHNGSRDEQPMETDSPEPSAEKKMAIKKITWP
ncbi:hypothetical protein ACOMHN_055412 [Nucella lapillus]